jgi:TonB family protein
MKHTCSTCALLAALAVTGCYTSQVSPDYARQSNQEFSRAEADPRRQAVAAEHKDAMLRLWADKPAYVAWLRDDRTLKKMPRLVSSAVPAYPLVPLLANVKATVVVSFVIDRSGMVEAARVLESSDSRFDQSAVEAVMKWKFLPAEFEDGPTLAVSAVPVVFDGKK